MYAPHLHAEYTDMMDVDSAPYPYQSLRNHRDIARYEAAFAIAHPELAGMLRLVVDLVVAALEDGRAFRDCRVFQCLADAADAYAPGGHAGTALAAFADGITTMLVAIRLDDERDRDVEMADAPRVRLPAPATPPGLPPRPSPPTPAYKRYTAPPKSPSPLRHVVRAPDAGARARLTVHALPRTMRVQAVSPALRAWRRALDTRWGPTSPVSDVADDDDFLGAALADDTDFDAVWDDDPPSLFPELAHQRALWGETLC